MNQEHNSRTVLLIIGPPGSGKSTYAAGSGLTHLEREHYHSDSAYLDAVTHACNQPDAQLAIVRTCPTLAEQHEWETLTQATRTVVLDLEPDECARRIHHRGRPRWRNEVAAARTWRTTRYGRPRKSVGVGGIPTAKTHDTRKTPTNGLKQPVF